MYWCVAFKRLAKRPLDVIVSDIQKNNSGVLEIKGARPHSVLSRLSNDRKKVTISYIEEKIELPVSERMAVRLNEPNAPYTKLIVQKPRQLDESYMKEFVITHRRLVQGVILSNVSDDSVDSDTLRILWQDDVFREASEDTRTQFERRYGIFSKRTEV
ncbi:MAG: hypothetical protein WA323_27335 [Candidatus Nitrosopolaris sp.]|jgi:hypothetical protein